MGKKNPAPQQPAPVAVPAAVPTQVLTPLRHWPWVLLSISLLFLIGVRLRLLGIPLERDEGGFAYIGKMMFEGQNLYTDLYDSKLPGLYFLYGAFVHLFGYSASGVHAGLLLCNVAATLLLFFLAKKLYRAEVAAWAVLVFAVMSTGINVFGFAAHATQLLLPFALGGLWVLVRELGRPSLRTWAVLLAGGLLGVAFLVKQQALFFMPFAALYLWVALRQRDQGFRAAALPILWLAVGSILPYLLVLAYLLAVGRGEAFWFWTYELPSNFGMVHQPGEKAELFSTMSSFVLRGQWGLWALAALGLLAVWRGGWGIAQKIFASALPVLAFGGVLMGSAYYPHYWVLVLPGVALLAALATQHLSSNALIIKAVTAVLLAAVLWAVASNATYYFADDHTQILRKTYTANPFPECAIIGAEIKKRSQPGDEMLVFGAEPELLVSTGLPSVTGHIFPYHLLDGQWYNEKFQKELFDAVAEREPRFVAVFTGGTSWQVTDLTLGNQMMNRLGPLVFDNPKYRRIGTVDIFSNTTIYKWDKEVAGYKPTSIAQIWLYEHGRRRK